MKIHHVTPYFHPEIGGLEESVKRFAEWQTNRGNEVVVHTLALTFSGERLPPEDQANGILVRRYAPVVRKGYYRTWFRPDLRGADLIHLHGYAVRTNDRVARTVVGTPLVFSLHHGVRMPHPDTTTRLFRLVYDQIEGIPTLRRAQRILVASEGDRPWLVRRRIPAERIRVLPTPLSDEAFIPGDSARGRELAGADRFILYVGRLHREKGVASLIDALPPSPPHVHIVFAGPDAGMGAALKARAEVLHLATRIRLLGRVSEEAKRSLLAGCACLALPSFHEAQGLAILEAWAQGRPVVATRVGALPELVTDSETGLLVSYGDVDGLVTAFNRILNSEAEARTMGERGRLVAERFRLHRIGPQLDAIYDEVTRESR